MPSVSTNGALAANGECAVPLTDSRTNLAAVVLPTPGGPYKIKCCGYGDANFDRSDLTALSCPTISFKLFGLSNSITDSVNLIFSSASNSSRFLISCGDSVSTFSSRRTCILISLIYSW